MRRTIILIVLGLVMVATVPGKTKTVGWLRGTWEGTGYQIDNNETWTMRLTASPRRFVIEYPSLKCSGRWRLLRVDANKAKFRERITLGISECTNNGRVVIERLSPQQVLFLYYNPGSNEVVASAVLKKAEGRRQ